MTTDRLTDAELQARGDTYRSRALTLARNSRRWRGEVRKASDYLTAAWKRTVEYAGDADERADRAEAELSNVRADNARLEAEAERLRVLERPRIVCLCGSTRFSEAFQDANLSETLAGHIVLSIGCNMKSDADIFGHLPQDQLDEIKRGLDALHFRKIEMADEILVLNVGGYVGTSTSNEIRHALKLGKPVRWLCPEYADATLAALTAAGTVRAAADDECRDCEHSGPCYCDEVINE